MQQFYSNGKLLITGEYVVLDGAKALALPTKFGQDLCVEINNDHEIIWESFNYQKKLWFACKFNPENIEINATNFDIKIAKTLQKILIEAQKLNPEFLKNTYGFHIKTHLTFPNNWGLGTSSTLINNVAHWADVDAFKLLSKSFGGSGYDIACAENNSPILYHLKENKPKVENIIFNPSFKEQLFFVHLNKKQNSKIAIKKYRKIKNDCATVVEDISNLTQQLVKSSSLSDFENILAEHEKIIGDVIQQKPVQQILFNDYFGQTKSLGAWGGDFILATGNEYSLKYFNDKGFNTVIPYQKMIL